MDFKNRTGGDTNGGKTYIYWAIGDDEIGSDEDCLVDVPNAVTADADATDTTGGYQRGNYATLKSLTLILPAQYIVKRKPCCFGNSNRSMDSQVGTIGVTSGKWYYEFENSVNWLTAAYLLVFANS